MEVETSAIIVDSKEWLPLPRFVAAKAKKAQPKIVNAVTTRAKNQERLFLSPKALSLVGRLEYDTGRTRFAMSQRPPADSVSALACCGRLLVARKKLVRVMMMLVY